MSSDSREELLSAYLDDEVSADERARVERWLAESAEYRQLYEELRAVRGQLQALPRHAAPSDVAASVLRRAEQESPRVAPGATVRPPSTGTPNTALGQGLRGRAGRMFFWPVVAVAAALLVALFNTQNDPRDVALDDARAKAPQQAELKAAPADAAPAATAEPSQTLGTRSRSATPTEGLEPDGAAADSVSPAADTVAPMMEKLAAPSPAPSAVPAVDRQPQAESFHYQGRMKLETDALRALENREQVSFIQLDASPDFVAEQQLEKLLESNKTTFHRRASPAALEQARQLTESNQAARDARVVADDEVHFTVEASPEQIEQIVTVLEHEQSRRRVSNLMVGVSELPQVEGARGKGASPESQQAPVTILLRKQAVPNR